MNPIISAEDISVSYGDNHVLSKMSLSVEEGRFIGILGPNGCGKTTFLRTLSRILKPDFGTVLIENQDIESFDSRTLAKTIGCVRQETDVSFPFTVREIVLMGRHPHVGRVAPLTENDLLIADEAMKTTNTLHLADRLITEISGGERQRVLIARTLAQQPKILLLDEPTSHLDINHQIEILRMIQSLTPKITVIGVFHDLNLASYFCDRIILMGNGSILAQGTPAEVLTSERILSSFQIRMIVATHPLTGKPHLVPEYGIKSSNAAKNIHVISGGGSGTEIFYTLSLYGYKVTAGVLSANDTDAVAAEALGIETIIEPPFAPVTEKSVEKLLAMVQDSKGVVIAETPFGFGNIANLKILLELAVPVYFLGELEDYTNGEAREIKDKLMLNGAEMAKDIPHLLELLSS